jgi:hypothetical protein
MGDNKVGPPQERLPERRDQVLATGRRLQIILKKDRADSPEVEIVGNRAGLRALAAICSGLADLAPEQLLTPANHYHLDEDFWGTDKGSVPLTVLCRESAWPEPSK